MNERIKELAEQSCEQVFGGKFGEMKLTMLFAEKFAELIVRECCDIFVELRTRPADLAVKDVKKHFGIE